MTTVFVAVDGGAREALAPVAAHCGSALEDTAGAAAETDDWWAERFTARPPDLLVAGTSDSARGRRVESAARRAAHDARIPAAAIEDFPGNYYDVPGGEAALVLVESAAARTSVLQRLGHRAPRVEVATPARYDRYRTALAEARHVTARSWSAQSRASVLWAGQPETGDGVRTLEALLPVLRDHGAALIFKAHPRDPGYAAGMYRPLLDASHIPVSDLTDASVEAAFALAPRLTVTQFSSIAIEGGFFGVPSLWVLLPEAGGVRLREKKGYPVPPLCIAGGAAHATGAHALAAVFEQAFTDIAYRENLMRCFDDYYRVRESGAELTARLLAEVAETK